MAQFLERFQAKWKPVRVKKTRQIKNLEPRFDSIETEKVLELREQAERCRRLARDCTDPDLRGSLLELVEELSGRASAAENDDTGVWQAGPDDRGAD
jgi:hypothetical protein